MPVFRREPVRVRVPATSANLGPGFDSAGLALGLHDEVVVRVVDRGLTVEVQGEGADDVPRSERHLVVASLRAAFDRLGGQPGGLEVTSTNRIPHARGLGSSAAAIVAAVVAARALVEDTDLDDDAALALATELEGHPDNVAACLRGGVTFAWTEPTGPRAVRLDAAEDLAPVVFIPSTTASTEQARGLLPEQVPHRDAAANAARAALLPLALSRDPSLLLAATEDLLHQQYRAPSQPLSADLVARLRADGLAAVTSGAGPTVLALTTTATRDAAAAHGEGWQVLALDVEPAGAHVVV